jgi:hypothetical protein
VPGPQIISGELAFSGCEELFANDAFVTNPGTVTLRTSLVKGISLRPSARSRSGSAPDPARPDALRAAGSRPSVSIRQNMSPPSPHMCGDVTAMTAALAIAGDRHSVQHLRQDRFDCSWPRQPLDYGMRSLPFSLVMREDQTMSASGTTSLNGC